MLSAVVAVLADNNSEVNEALSNESQKTVFFFSYSYSMEDSFSF